MLKPKAVTFRVALWKLFFNNKINNEIPKSGLNFLYSKSLDRDFLLLCGFEKFRDYYVRIDILEKLFIKIIENTKNKKFKINSDMINLLGCIKESFYSLLTLMNYKKDKDKEDTYFFIGDRRTNFKKK